MSLLLEFGEPRAEDVLINFTISCHIELSEDGLELWLLEVVDQTLTNCAEVPELNIRSLAIIRNKIFNAQI